MDPEFWYRAGIIVLGSLPVLLVLIVLFHYS
jgi:hypothetical protein